MPVLRSLTSPGEGKQVGQAGTAGPGGVHSGLQLAAPPAPPRLHTSTVGRLLGSADHLPSAAVAADVGKRLSLADVWLPMGPGKDGASVSCSVLQAAEVPRAVCLFPLKQMSTVIIGRSLKLAFRGQDRC